MKLQQGNQEKKERKKGVKFQCYIKISSKCKHNILDINNVH